MKTRPNTNCLVGFRCPECGSYGNFWIDAMILARVLMSDNGTVEQDVQSTDWDDDSAVECLTCGHSATVSEFTGGKK
jgi:DNA-directed RNA polymerase subunit RPC12/RpoP